MITFTLDNDQEIKLKSWLKERNEVYTGAIGIIYSITFTASSIGEFVKVKHPDGSELDLTGNL